MKVVYWFVGVGMFTMACGGTTGDKAAHTGSGVADADQAAIPSSASDMHVVGAGGGPAHSGSIDPEPASTAEDDSCESLSERKCLETAGKVDGCISIVGDRYSEEGACVESSFVVCTASCPDGAALTFMRDDQGALWRFPSTCVPEGWHVFQSADDPRLGVFEDAEECSEG